MISANLRKAWRFFHANAGYATPPGKAVCAMNLARAELEMNRRDWHVEWVDDEDGWNDLRADGFKCSCGCGKKIETCECALLRDEQGEVIGSLGAIWDADDSYRRVIRAELASQAISELTGNSCRI